MKSRIMRSASKRGQVGKSWKSETKYSGRMIAACSVSASPTMMSRSQSGEAR